MKKAIRLIIFFFASLFVLSAIATTIFVVQYRSQIEQLIIAMASCTESVSVASSAKAPRILFVGNSFTFCNMTPNTVSKIAAGLTKESPQVTQLVFPNYTLEDHYKKGHYQTLLREQKFDYVVLQEQSYRSLIGTASTIEYGQKMAELARQSGAKVFLFEIWADRNRPDDQSKIDSNALLVASKIGAQLVRIGDAFFYARSRFPDIQLYAEDGHHPSQYGSYLASCVLFHSLYNRTSLGAPVSFDYSSGFFHFPVIVVSPATAAKLQQVAEIFAQSRL